MTLVRNIMERDVATIPPNASVVDLIQLLDRHGISGAPVVDNEEILVGVVSQRDIIHLASKMEQVPEAMRWEVGVRKPMEDTADLGDAPEGEFFAYYVTPTGEFVDARGHIRNLPTDVFEGYRVEDIMTPAPVMIDAAATLGELARFLLERKIHRALVVDSGKFIGIVTTVDVLKGVAEARP